MIAVQVFNNLGAGKGFNLLFLTLYIYYIKIFEYFQMNEGFSRFRIFPRLDITVSSITIWGTTYNTYPLCQFLVIPENFLGDFIFYLRCSNPRKVSRDMAP